MTSHLSMAPWGQPASPALDHERLQAGQLENYLWAMWSLRVDSRLQLQLYHLLSERSPVNLSLSGLSWFIRKLETIIGSFLLEVLQGLNELTAIKCSRVLAIIILIYMDLHDVATTYFIQVQLLSLIPAQITLPTDLHQHATPFMPPALYVLFLLSAHPLPQVGLVNSLRGVTSPWVAFLAPRWTFVHFFSEFLGALAHHESHPHLGHVSAHLAP